jgi:hypothetical protein
MRRIRFCADAADPATGASACQACGAGTFSNSTGADYALVLWRRFVTYMSAHTRARHGDVRAGCGIFEIDRKGTQFRHRNK